MTRAPPLHVPEPSALTGPDHTEAAARAAVAASLARVTGAGDIAVAVSGGSDSSALMHLTAPIARAAGRRLRVVTVDHRLRPESAAEAAAVAHAAKALGLRHDTLVWDAHPAGGNVMDQARSARRRLIGAFAAEQGIAMVLLGHTASDVAEGLLMRLSRRAGVDGLAAMADWWMGPEGVIWARPLLAVTRQDLRDWLVARDLSWIEDPTNEDRSYARTRARAALAALAPLGIDVADLAASARHLRDAREALALMTAEAARRCTRAEAGDLHFDAIAFGMLSVEIRRRLLIGALGWIAGQGYPPRHAALARFAAAAEAGDHATLNGCRLEPAPAGFRIGRELDAVRHLSALPGAAWDGRWRLHGPPPPTGATLRALGAEGLKACPNWRETGLPRASLMALPALFVGPDLVSAPHAGRAGAWKMRLVPGREDFAQSLLAH